MNTLREHLRPYFRIGKRFFFSSEEASRLEYKLGGGGSVGVGGRQFKATVELQKAVSEPETYSSMKVAVTQAEADDFDRTLSSNEFHKSTA